MLGPSSFLFFFFYNSHLRICLLFLDREEREGVSVGGWGRGRERGERETLIGCLPYTPQTGIEPTTFGVLDDAPTN